MFFSECVDVCMVLFDGIWNIDLSALLHSMIIACGIHILHNFLGFDNIFHAKCYTLGLIQILTRFFF